MSRTAVALVVLLTAVSLASTACQSSSTNVLGPSGTKCGITLPGSVPTIASAGGPGSLTVTVAPECVWKASSDADWIAITSNANGQGSGVVGFVASGNPTALTRRASLTVGEARVELAQGGAPCQFTLTPATQTFGTDGGEGTVSVAVIDGCQWTATSNASWLSVIGTPNGTGTGTVRYHADANSGSTRSATVKIADRTFVVNQAGTGTPCSVSLGQSERLIAAAGGDDVVSVTAAAECPWTATSHASWITVTSGESGNGTGVVRLSIEPNTGGQRVGLVTITGQTYAVTQAGAVGTCSYSIAAPGQSVPAAATAVNVEVSASSGCAWTAVSHVAWITITSSNVGNGSGVLALAIASNTGAARVGVVTIAGFSYTVTQEAVGSSPPSPVPCTYGISSTQLAAPATGATSVVNVTAGTGCSWTATTEVSWITVMSGASGSGSGSVNIAVATNAGAARTGTVTIAGQSYTVTQQAAGSSPPPVSCTYTISSAQLAVPASGATTAVNVTAGTGCDWTATTAVSWITVTSGASGSGNGTVNLAVAANGGAARTGIVTIAGQTFTVTQAAAACTYSINPTTQTVSLLGGSFSVEVTTQAWCTWTAATDDSWIQMTSATTGVGNGTLTYDVPLVSLGLLFSRTGTITVSGRVLTVNQKALLSNDR